MRKMVVLLALLAAGAASAQQGSATCVAAIKGSLRDPGSMQLGRVTREGRPFTVTVDGREQSVRGYELVVNARNAFGGYVGAQLWRCVVDDATERSLVRLLPPGG